MAKKSRVEILRRILKRHQAEKIDGYLVDVQTANMLLTVYRALNPKNKRRFGRIPLTVLVDLGWKQVKAG